MPDLQPPSNQASQSEQGDQSQQGSQSGQGNGLSVHDQNVLAQLFASEQTAFPLYISKSYAKWRKPEVVRLEAEAFGTVGHDHAKALELLQAANGIDPDDPSVYNNMAIIYGQAGDASSAMSCLGKAILLDNDTEILQRAYLQRALLHEQGGRCKEMELDLERAARHGSREAQARLKLPNPYATMCSAIVAQAMSKYRS